MNKDKVTKTNNKFTIQLLLLITFYPILYIVGTFFLMILLDNSSASGGFWFLAILVIPIVWLLLFNIFLKQDKEKSKIILKNLLAMTLIIGIALAICFYQVHNAPGWDGIFWSFMVIFCGAIIASYIMGIIITLMKTKR